MCVYEYITVLISPFKRRNAPNYVQYCTMYDAYSAVALHMQPFRNARTIVATWMAFQIGLYVYCIQQPLFASHMISILELFQLQLVTILS